MGLFTVVILNLGVYIWSIIMQNNFRMNNPGKIDWDDSSYARSFLPYFFVQTTGPLSQSYMYWLLSSFATDAQGKLPVFYMHVPESNFLQQMFVTVLRSVVLRLSGRQSRTA
jgi:hypothetical protein